VKGEVTGDKAEGIAGARKDDAGKAPIYRGVLSYFPAAVRGVSQVSLFGASKYAWNGWCYVPDGFNRYSDGLLRHLVAEAEGEVLDAESGLHHDLHSAWNALARAELRIRAEKAQ
jgi:Domain of unknown function (DUF5664)